MSKPVRVGKMTHPTTQPKAATPENQCGARDRKGRACHRIRNHRGKHQAQAGTWLIAWDGDAHKTK